MRYTTLRVTEAGVVLFAAHRVRLCGSGEDEAAFDAWSRTASAGIYALRLEEGRLTVEARPASRLVDGMPTRLAVSPVASRIGAFPKPAPPSEYTALRRDGVATLLTDRSGTSIFESCAAAVLAWDGATLVLAPEDAPRVASLAEACVAAALPHRRAPISTDATWPLLLVNAVAVASPTVQGRTPFPGDVKDRVAAALASSTRRSS